MQDSPRPQPIGLVAFAAAAGLLSLLAGASIGPRDAGELTTAAFLLDVPHPTGFAADMVILRTAMLLPVGDVAFRANIVSALFMALAAALGARITYALCADLEARARSVLAMLPVAALVASRSVMRAGTATEVYALALAVTLGALALAIVDAPADRSDAWRLRVTASLLGLVLVVHTSARPAVVLAFGLLLARSASPRVTARRVVATVIAAISTALMVVYLPLASGRNGPIDWGDPRTLASLIGHLGAARIRASFAHRILVPWRIPEDLAQVARVLAEDLGPVLLAAGIIGGLLAARSKLARWIALIALVDLAYATVINPMGVADRQTLFAAEACLVILAAFGIARAGQWIATRAPRLQARWTVPIAAVALAVLSLARADLAFAARADGWAATEILGGAGALGESPSRAIVLCESDDLCGESLYAQFVEGERPDALVLPRQHLADPSTWRRVGGKLAGLVVAAPAPGGLRVARLRAIVAQFPDRLRWEQGEIDDERLTAVALGSSETPVLAAIATPVTSADRNAYDWLAPRLAYGVGARWLGAQVLFGAGRRVATVDLSQAVPLWRGAIGLDPEHASSYTNLGVARARSGDLRDAIRLTERAVELDPDRVVAWRNLAEYRRAVGDDEGAASALSELRRRVRH